MSTISQLCRACLSTKDTFTYIFFENLSPDMYYFCTSIEVLPDEKLPKALCNTCYELLNKYAEFKQTCLQSQKTLFGYRNDMCENVPTRTSKDMQDFKNIDMKLKVEAVDAFDLKVESDPDDFGCGTSETNDVPDGSLLTNVEEVELKTRKTKKLVKLKCRGSDGVQSKRQPKKFLYTCDVCHRKFNYHARFEAHKLEHEGKTVSINCEPCNKTFATWSGLKRHTDSEHTAVSLRSLRCLRCGKISKSRHTLAMHMKMHQQRRVCVCHVCGKGFTTSVVLRAHLETHKENRERPFACEHCGKKFYTNTMLTSHVSRQHTGRRYICQTCEYPFTDKYNLAKHLLLHDGKKLHKCDICHKSYAAQSTLQEHKRIHSGERPYGCGYCPKGFISKKRLTDHERIHTGDKPYKCTVCDQRFTQRGTVKRHMKVHDRPPSIA